MLYSNSHTQLRKSHPPLERFYSLLRQERYDKALELQGDPANEIGSEVFLLTLVKEAGIKAVILSIKIGQVEDPKQMMERFHLSDAIFEEFWVKEALRDKLRTWEAMNHPHALRFKELYRF